MPASPPGYAVLSPWLCCLVPWLCLPLPLSMPASSHCPCLLLSPSAGDVITYTDHQFEFSSRRRKCGGKQLDHIPSTQTIPVKQAAAHIYTLGQNAPNKLSYKLSNKLSNKVYKKLQYITNSPKKFPSMCCTNCLTNVPTVCPPNYPTNCTTTV